MNLTQPPLRWLIPGIILVFFGIFLAGCASEPDGGEEMLTLPELNSADLAEGQLLQVVATTNIIGDVVSQVGGQNIALTTLLGPGQDPHSYVPAARDLTAVAGANVIFINGWDLEEGLVEDLRTIAEDALFVPISANIEPLPFGDEAGHEHAADPHVWFSINNVQQWTNNVEEVFVALDPANAKAFEANAAEYRAKLNDLSAYAEAELGTIPEERRFLVTNHDAFSYLEADYGLETLGTVIPGASTLAEPSASDLSDLIATMKAHELCTIFTETALSEKLAQTVAGELDYCDEVKVLPLYSGSLGTSGSGADSYTGMFSANIETIVSGLQ
jgi:manganese/iron transport system substrate-binding protein